MSWHLLAAIAAVVAGFTEPGPRTEPAETLLPDLPPEIEVIDLENERYRRLTVPVTIGEHGPFQFLIDTGSQATVLSRQLADRLELFEREQALLVAMASRKHVEVTTVPDFGLGSRRFPIQTAPLIEAEHIGGADGILGLDSLQNQRVLLDFAKKEILVADSETLGGNRGYEIVVKARSRLGQLIITEARLDGVRVAVIVDTGAEGSVGNPVLLERLRRTRSFGETELTDVNGAVLAGPLKIARQLEVGRASVQNFPILFADSPTFRSLDLADEPALILGMSELKLFKRVAIDFKERRVLFDLPPGASWRGNNFGALSL